ncbi:MAG: PIN domain-containing protein [Anaerolineae bacterium]|jgi:predicted nucleic acid-binding protein|nr:PIN domain-containing protein [Anaerolineae bacterium]
MTDPQVSKAIIDTSALIDVLDGVQSAIDLVLDIPEVYMPIFVLAEAYYMAENSRDKAKNYLLVENLRQRFALLDVNLDIAREYARVKHDVRLTHPKMPHHDLWIAACARTFSLPLIAKDKHFAVIPNLRIITW